MDTALNYFTLQTSNASADNLAFAQAQTDLAAAQVTMAIAMAQADLGGGKKIKRTSRRRPHARSSRTTLPLRRGKGVSRRGKGVRTL